MGVYVRRSAPEPVILSPKRAEPAANRTPRAKDLAAGTYKPGRGSGQGCRGLGCRGPSPGRADTRATLSHKQRGRGGTLRAWVWAGRPGARAGAPQPQPFPRKLRGGREPVGCARPAGVQFRSPPPLRSGGRGPGGGGCRGMSDRPSNLDRSSPLSRRSLPGEGPGEGPARGMRWAQVTRPSEAQGPMPLSRPSREVAPG
jgi:hypothetical protein